MYRSTRCALGQFDHLSQSTCQSRFHALTSIILSDSNSALNKLFITQAMAKRWRLYLSAPFVE